jgi:thymidylate kinase
MRCARVTIFEGPDGSGKSTTAARYAAAAGARMVHCGPFPRQTAAGLGRTYLEAMLPALLGYQEVVLDRCWTSEGIYGAVFRDGADRLGVVGRRILERVAMRCDARLVLCLPPVEICLAHWRRRHAEGGEYLERETQLQEVYRRYGQPGLTQLAVTTYDYTRDEGYPLFYDRGLRHDVVAQTSGHAGAKVLLVGEALTEPTDRNGPDTLYPFGDLSRGGCTQWLTRQLADADIQEADLLWTNADAPGAAPTLKGFTNRFEFGARNVVALGERATAWLVKQGVAFITVTHPQSWRRFHHHETYPLIKILKELT